jgi:DNA-binding MarR family transcriptional regulator
VTPKDLSPGARKQLAAWRAAIRWPRAVEVALAEVELTFSEYLVLQAAALAIQSSVDAVPQTAIAELSGFDQATTSKQVKKLEARGLLDRSIDGVDGRRWRVLVTGRGLKVLRRASARVDAGTRSVERTRG